MSLSAASPSGELSTRPATVFYDGACSLCTKQALRLKRLARDKVAAVPIQEADLRGLPLTLEDGLKEIKLVLPSGEVFGGAEALVQTIRVGFPALRPLTNVYYLPPVRWFSDRLYRWVARNRYRLFGTTEECADGCHVRGP